MTTRNMNIYKFTKRQLPEVNKKVRRMCVCLGGGGSCNKRRHNS